MRVTTAFNRILAIPGAWVVSVAFTDAGVVVGLRRRRRYHRCVCGVRASAYDHSRRRWRHLDLAACKLWLEADIWRVDCRACGRVRTEDVPWARPGARLSRDFEDVIAWLAQRTDKTSICRLLRVSWETVHAVVIRVVDEHLDDSRLDGLFNLGVDEISYKRGYEYLTVVADHDTGKVVWVAKGRNQEALTSFFRALGKERCGQVQAISMDLAPIWREPCATFIPQAAICLDPFHVVRLANQALEVVYRNVQRQRDKGVTAREWRCVRNVLRAGVEKLDDDQRRLLREVRRTSYELWSAWELKEELRDLYRKPEPGESWYRFREWLDVALASGLRPFVNLARQLERHFEGIVAAVEHGLSNSRLEGINSKIRLINRRGYGHPSAGSLAAMIHLCLGGIVIALPTGT